MSAPKQRSRQDTADDQWLATIIHVEDLEFLRDAHLKQRLNEGKLDERMRLELEKVLVKLPIERAINAEFLVDQRSPTVEIEEWIPKSSTYEEREASETEDERRTRISRDWFRRKRFIQQRAMEIQLRAEREAHPES